MKDPILIKDFGTLRSLKNNPRDLENHCVLVDLPNYPREEIWSYFSGGMPRDVLLQLVTNNLRSYWDSWGLVEGCRFESYQSPNAQLLGTLDQLFDPVEAAFLLREAVKSHVLPDLYLRCFRTHPPEEWSWKDGKFFLGKPDEFQANMEEWKSTCYLYSMKSYRGSYSYVPRVKDPELLLLIHFCDPFLKPSIRDRLLLSVDTTMDFNAWIEELLREVLDRAFRQLNPEV